MEQVMERISIPGTDPKRQALREALDLLDAEHGPIGKEAEEWASGELARAFLEISSSMQGSVIRV